MSEKQNTDKVMDVAEEKAQKAWNLYTETYKKVEDAVKEYGDDETFDKCFELLEDIKAHYSDRYNESDIFNFAYFVSEPDVGDKIVSQISKISEVCDNLEKSRSLSDIAFDLMYAEKQADDAHAKELKNEFRRIEMNIFDAFDKYGEDRNLHKCLVLLARLALAGNHNYEHAFKWIEPGSVVDEITNEEFERIEKMFQERIEELEKSGERIDDDFFFEETKLDEDEPEL